MRKIVVTMVAAGVVAGLCSLDAAAAEKKAEESTKSTCSSGCHGKSPAKDKSSSAEKKGCKGEGRGADFFAAADKDGDEALSLEEFTAAHAEKMKKRFEKMDADKDGKLTKKEMKKARKHRGSKGSCKEKSSESGKKSDKSKD